MAHVVRRINVAHVDLEIVRGDTFEVEFWLTFPTLAPIVPGDWAVAATLHLRSLEASPLATFVDALAVVPGEPEKLAVALTMTAANTALLPVRSPLLWRLRATTPDARTVTPIHGVILEPRLPTSC